MSSHDLQSHSSRNASSEDLEPFLGQSGEKPSYHRRSRKSFMRRDFGPALPWILTTGIMSILCATLAVRPFDGFFAKGNPEPRCKTSNTYEAGFDTDLDVVKPLISTHQVRFRGGLLKHDDGTLYREHVDGEPYYFGEPTPELKPIIDAAWSDLLYSSAVDLEGEEANAVKNSTFEEPLGNMWRTGLDVFHALHCVNLVRKAFDAEHYPEDFDDPPRLVRLHREHCLDYLRQQVMCHADLSPVMLKWDAQVKYLIPQFTTQMHTCRNFEAIHEWSKARAAERYFDINDKMIVDAVKAGEM